MTPCTLCKSGGLRCHWTPVTDMVTWDRGDRGVRCDLGVVRH